MKMLVKFIALIAAASALLALASAKSIIPAKGIHTNSPKFTCTANSSEGSSGKNFAPGTKWPGGKVPFVVHPSLTPEDIVQVLAAFEIYHKSTCIRFQPKLDSDLNYISIENDPNVCGTSHICQKGGMQRVAFGGACRNANVMVHELGHTLCLQHEHEREDRDNYVQFNSAAADDCKVPEKSPNSETLGMLYDYKSTMHGSCDARCMMPTMEEVGESDCGGSFSVLDAEKINAFYGCNGCLNYRFRPAHQLTEDERRDLFEFGPSPSGEPMFLCRAYHKGHIIPGSFDGSLCSVPYHGLEYQYSGSGVEAFTFSGPGKKLNENENGQGQISSYTWKKVGEHEQQQNREEWTIPDTAVAGGREKNGATTYIGLCIIQKESKFGIAVGKFWPLNLIGPTCRLKELSTLVPCFLF